MRDPLRGYDQWKTASPFDDEMDPEDIRLPIPYDMDSSILPESMRPNDEQREQIKALHDHMLTWRSTNTVKPATFEEVSECFPEGDFKWDNDDPGDAHVYCCGERDCPVQWHEAFYCETIERKDGKLTIEIHDGDSDGNWDINTAWEEGEDWDNSGVGYHFGEYQLRMYFYHWAEYWIDAAETGKDPCNQTMTRPMGPSEWVDFCIKAAKSNVDALPLKEKG